MTGFPLRSCTVLLLVVNAGDACTNTRAGPMVQLPPLASASVTLSSSSPFGCVAESRATSVNDCDAPAASVSGGQMTF